MKDTSAPDATSPQLGRYITNKEILNKLDAHLKTFGALIRLVQTASMNDANRAHLNAMLCNKSMFEQFEVANNLLISLIADLRYRFPDGDGR